MSTDKNTSIQLTTRDEGFYKKRGNVHNLEYYDGPLLEAQMVVASEDTKLVEIFVDNRAAETDGYSIYFRVTRNDLETMLRMLDEQPVEKPRWCNASPGTDQSGCLVCTPGPHEDRDQ